MGIIAPPRPIRFVLWITVVCVMLFSIVRLTLLLRNLELLNTGIDNTISWVLRSLWMGVRFDVDFVTKLMVLPLLLLGLGNILAPRLNKWFAAAATWLAALTTAMALMLDITDIAFFEYCNSHLNALAISYIATDLGQAAELVAEESNYLWLTIFEISIAVLFTLFVLRLARHYRLSEVDGAMKVRTATYLIILCGLITFTSRGMTFQPRPLRSADAMISNNNFLNQLCINPIKPFLETIFAHEERVINLMDSDDAFDYACEAMERDDSFTHHIEANTSPWRNVVIIAQEGNTAERLAREGNTQGLLSNLDRLIGEGRYYENTYASSTHTCYGIYALVTSLPPYMHLHPLKDGVQHSLGTVYEQLYARGEMKTLFFITHRPDFDNMNSFIPMQGFEELISEEDYDFKTDKTWGVDDHIMFDRALQEIDKAHSEGDDVAAVLLTCSNHKPFDAPIVDGFTPRSTDAEEMAIEYADWAMNRFLEMAKERVWFDETLFVITADHGRPISADYIMNESIFHIPLLFYSPKHIAPEVCSDLVAQVDITPTAFSMLGKEFYNRTMGIDITTEKREYAVATSVGHLSCRSRRWLYAYNPETEAEYLYDLDAEGESRLANVAHEHRDTVEKMHHHAIATIQAGWDIHNTTQTDNKK